MKKILIVEDDENIGPSLAKFFEDESYSVSLAPNLEDARTKVDSSIDLIILDWMLPDGQGVDFLKEVRDDRYVGPIIMLTARTDLIDKIVGLESGANDYLTKPFEPRELLARVRAQLRTKKIEKAEDSKISHNELEININRREVFYSTRLVELTKMEFDLLRLLAESPGRPFSREEILNKVWGFEHFPSTRTVDTHVLQLRQKISEDLIETVWGVGYRLKS